MGPLCSLPGDTSYSPAEEVFGSQLVLPGLFLSSPEAVLMHAAVSTFPATHHRPFEPEAVLPERLMATDMLLV